MKISGEFTLLFKNLQSYLLRFKKWILRRAQTTRSKPSADLSSLSISDDYFSPEYTQSAVHEKDQYPHGTIEL